MQTLHYLVRKVSVLTFLYTMTMVNLIYQVAVPIR